MLGKILGKKSGYYLELPEEEIDAIPEPPATPAAPAPAPTAPVAATAAVETATATETPAADSNSKNKKTKTAAAAPQAPAVSSRDPVDIIRAAIAASGNSSQPTEEPPAEPTFAGDYLMPNPSPRRRRPGPSMSPFKSMAKDMKKTTAGF